MTDHLINGAEKHTVDHTADSGMTSTVALAGWRPGLTPAAFAPDDMPRMLACFRHPMHIVRHEPTGHLGLAVGGEMVPAGASAVSLLGSLPPIYPY
ncbi:hypothetical protein [Mycobacterium riyadhense]|uniref:Uncharacterized protein n=1 Tax=Mycobacterium riyadhense TaxID=486698 RepID=A0A1X2CJ00_9MYCO|nr:hypothetical protein [Mycobacterium riyadhense]MCV7147943.1 hypothetical protein [Mycobacterium riyadhense]ORW75995.1 hypothetical protein AWC22_21870 [Mycobacterium riyadhense]